MSWSVTFEIVTPASAEQGEADESGFVGEGLSLREAIAQLGYGRPTRRRPFCLENCGRWFATQHNDPDFRTGAVTNYAIHPPDSITRASYARVRRLLTGR